MRLIPSVIYSSIAYFMIGLQASIDRFLVFLFTLFLSTVFGSATCFFVASSIPIFGKNKNGDRSALIRRSSCFVDHCHFHLRGDDGLQWVSHRSGEHLSVSAMDSLVQCLSLRDESLDGEWIPSVELLRDESDEELFVFGRRSVANTSDSFRNRLGSVE